MENFELKTFDGETLIMYLWKDVEKPKGVVQLIHGMSEYLGRYDDFAKFLNSQGYIVLGDDHRAHGKTAKDVAHIGKVEEHQDIFNDTLLDELHIIKTFKKEFKDLPYFVFSHSYGSFITQRLIQKCKEKVNGVVLCGSAFQKNASDIMFGRMVASIMPKNSNAKIIENSSFKQYNKKFKNGSWITRDIERTKNYVEDKFCGVPFSYGFYKSMFNGMLNNYKKENVKNIPSNLPIFIISGGNDPVGHNGKRVNKLYKFYKSIGLNNAQIKIYPDARHELLNELNKEEVYNDILNFFNNNLEK